MDVRDIRFEPFSPDFPREFDAKWQSDLGVKTRIAAHTMTRTQAELVEIGRDQLDVTESMVDFMVALRDQANALVQLADAALSRLIVAAHIGHDVEWRDEDEQPENE